MQKIIEMNTKYTIHAMQTDNTEKEDRFIFNGETEVNSPATIKILIRFLAKRNRAHFIKKFVNKTDANRNLGI